MRGTWQLSWCVSLALSSLAGWACGSDLIITPVEAIHLVERLVNPQEMGRRILVTRVSTFEDRGRTLYTVEATEGKDSYQATVDARRARVLSVSRNGEVFYQWKGPLVVGHRGNVRFAPENTLPAFEVAIRYGADLVEMDIRETRDGELVIIHDETLDRTTDGQGKVAEHTLAELKRLDAGSWFGPQFKGTRIPTLREALHFTRGKVLPDLDFKAGDPRKLIAVLKEEGLLGRVTLYCGDWNLLRQTRRLTQQFWWRPTVPFGRIGLPLLVNEFDPPIVNVDWEQFSERLIRDIHLAGRKSFVNTMQQDTEWAIETALETAPDYIQSDRIEIVVQLLRNLGLRP